MFVGAWEQALNCYNTCEAHLRTVDNRFLPNVIPEMYNYLQFSYYQRKFSLTFFNLINYLCVITDADMVQICFFFHLLEGDFKAAMSSCLSFLLFDPDNGVMLRNKEFYETKISDSSVEPRPVTFLFVEVFNN